MISFMQTYKIAEKKNSKITLRSSTAVSVPAKPKLT
jgi:hypothetical protein